MSQRSLQAATLGDSLRQKMELLLDCVEVKLNSQNYYCPPGRLLMISGELNERIGRPDSLDIGIANMPPDTLGIKLDQNQPNPFSVLTEIQYFINMTTQVRLSLYDYNGKEIAILIDKYIKPGWHSLIVNGSGLNNGLYILLLEANGKKVIKTIHKRD